MFVDSDNVRGFKKYIPWILKKSYVYFYSLINRLNK